MKLSIIVPVYNVQEYIEKCIYSIINQSIKEIEILIINDGCKDKSIEKVRKINDDRIKIINQSNAGLSAARNTGINNSSGEYLVFIDSDDYYINNFCLEEMYCIAKNTNADIVVGNAVAYFPNNESVTMTRNKEIFKAKVLNNEDFLIEYLQKKSMFAPVWLNIYNRKLFEKGIRFKEGILHEDEEFTPRIFLKANKVAVYPKEFYGYRQREGSITNQKNKTKNTLDIIDSCFELEKIFNQIDNKKLSKLYKDYLVTLMLSSLAMSKTKVIPRNTIGFLIRNSKSLKNKTKVIIYTINKDLYYFINNK